MSIATEISRLQTAKANIKAAIESRGVSVPSGATLDTYANLISSIPDRYTILEYIESDGTFYIPTDVSLTNSQWWEYKFQSSLNPGSSHLHIFSGVSYRVAQITGNGYFYVRRGDLSTRGANTVLISTGNTLSVGTDRTVACFRDGDGIYVDNVLNKSLAADAVPTDSVSAWFFTVNHSSDAATYGAKGKLYYLKIGQGNSALYNFIPAKRNSDNNVGLYDAVNNVFYPSVSVN